MSVFSIFHLRFFQQQTKLSPNFLKKNNPHISSQMRAILVNWIINVHQSFNLVAETLYMAVSMIDRFFDLEPVSKSKIQLVGVTCLFISAKFEEVYYPEIAEFVHICDNTYTSKDILAMELKVLASLEFQLARPIPLSFLRRGSKAAHAEGKTHVMAKYLCELSLTELECAHWNPSLVAAVSLYLSLRMLQPAKDVEDSVWTATIAHYTRYTEQQVLEHAAVLCKVILNAETSKYQVGCLIN